MSINKAILVGNVGREPEIRYVEKGVAVATFPLATSERYKLNDKTIERTEWHNIVAWRQLATVAENYIHKGTQLYVEGRLQTRQWERDGQRHTVTEIVAETIQLLGSRTSDSDSLQGEHTRTN